MPPSDTASRESAIAVPVLSTRFTPELPARLIFFILGPALYLVPLFATTLLPLSAAAVAWLAWRRGVAGLAADLGRGWIWLPLVLLMAASAIWALDPAAALILALRLAGLLTAGVILAGALRRLPEPIQWRLLRGLAAGLSLGAAIVLADLASGSRLAILLHGPLQPGFATGTGYSRGNVFQAILVIPLALGLWRGGSRRLALIQLVLGTAAILCCGQLAAKLALGCGLGTGLLVLALPVLRWLVPAVLVLVLAGLPWRLPITLAPETQCWVIEHKPSAMHRVAIWDWVDGRIREKPLLGWGLDAARRMPGGQDRIRYRGCADPPDAAPRVDGQVLPLHPHDAALQIWLELGGVGALAAGLALIVSLMRGWRGLNRRRTAPLAAMAAAGLGPALISFGIWQEWWVASLMLAAAAGAALGRAGTPG